MSNFDARGSRFVGQFATDTLPNSRIRESAIQGGDYGIQSIERARFDGGGVEESAPKSSGTRNQKTIPGRQNSDRPFIFPFRQLFLALSCRDARRTCHPLRLKSTR